MNPLTDEHSGSASVRQSEGANSASLTASGPNVTFGAGSSDWASRSGNYNSSSQPWSSDLSTLTALTGNSSSIAIPFAWVNNTFGHNRLDRSSNNNINNNDSSTMSAGYAASRGAASSLHAVALDDYSVPSNAPPEPEVAPPTPPIQFDYITNNMPMRSYMSLSSMVPEVGSLVLSCSAESKQDHASQDHVAAPQLVACDRTNSEVSLPEALATCAGSPTHDEQAAAAKANDSPQQVAAAAPSGGALNAEGVPEELDALAAASGTSSSSEGSRAAQDDEDDDGAKPEPEIIGGLDNYPDLQIEEFEARYLLERNEYKIRKKLREKEVALYLWRARCARRNVTTDYVSKYNDTTFNEREKKLLASGFEIREHRHAARHQASLEDLSHKVHQPGAKGDLSFPPIVKTAYNPLGPAKVWPAAPWRRVDEEVERQLAIIEHLDKLEEKQGESGNEKPNYKYFPDFS